MNWTAAIGCAFIAGAIGGARAGMNARKRNQEPDEIKREKDKKLVEKVRCYLFIYYSSILYYRFSRTLNKEEQPIRFDLKIIFQVDLSFIFLFQKDEKNGPNEAVKGKSGCTAAVRNDEVLHIIC